MTTATMIEAKNLSSPDEVRRFADHGQAEVFKIGGREVLRGTFEPGWQWSNDVKPIAKTSSCEAAHFGLCVSGRMTIKMDDGTEVTCKEGDLIAIPPGHDAWVDGDEACILVDFGDIADYAKPHEH